MRGGHVQNERKAKKELFALQCKGKVKKINQVDHKTIFKLATRVETQVRLRYTREQSISNRFDRTILINNGFFQGHLNEVSKLASNLIVYMKTWSIPMELKEPRTSSP